MAFSKAVFARKLSSLRSDFGQDLNYLSLTSGISIERLSLLENASVEPTGDEILILADYYKKDFLFFISDNKPDPDEELEVLFRKSGDELSKDDRLSISEFIFLCRNQDRLEKLLSIVRPRLDFHFIPHGTHYKSQGRECSKELRRHLQLSDREVVRDLFHELRKMGIKVFRRKLQNSNISGLYIKHPEAGACILVNLAEGVARQRFSAAHELAHVLLDNQQSTLSLAGQWSSADLIELRANSFASHFLMPRELLASARGSGWSDPNKISDWASRLRVSVPALLYALLDAEEINRKVLEELRNSGPRPRDTPDPELEGSLTSAQIERKSRLLDMGLTRDYVNTCFEAFASGHISAGLLGDMLLSHSSETHEIASLFGVTINRE